MGSSFKKIIENCNFDAGKLVMQGYKGFVWDDINENDKFLKRRHQSCMVMKMFMGRSKKYENEIQK